jgi:RNA polymerase sigma factor (sigma-70 family)
MPETDDIKLLREFAENNSEEAFAALVGRHVNLVYSVALRSVGNSHSAEEITQAVFIILARKAKSFSRQTILTGWLHQTTRLTAANFLRTEIRRQNREQEAFMQSALSETETWTQIAPLLDDAISKLNERDRNAILLRYFENKSAREMAAALRVDEPAAQKRVTRAVEKLRAFFAKRGVTLTAAAIAGAVSANSVQAAPIGLAATVTAAAAKGAAVSASTLTLIKGALKIMAWTKMKMAIATGIIVLLAAGTATVTINKIRHPNFKPEDFWATSYPTGMDGMMTNYFGHPLNSTFPIQPIQLCSISGLLDQCMELSGWRYLIDKEVAAGGVKFGNAKVLNGEEWLAAFENALQTNKPEWWDAKLKRQRQENLVLIRYPEQKIILVLPKDKAAKYQ